MKKILKRLTPWHWLIIAIITIWGVSIVRRRYLNHTNKESLMNNNVKAFLLMLRHAEGTSGVNGYRTVYSYEKVLKDLSDHPHTTGEWKGKTLSDAHCKGAGLSSGCKSTAAGAYQITISTWKRLKSKLGLKDFSPESQDLAAIELIREKVALKDIEAGKLSTAISKVRKVWASLPGAGYSQPEKSLASLTKIFQSAGGQLA